MRCRHRAEGGRRGLRKVGIGILYPFLASGLPANGCRRYKCAIFLDLSTRIRRAEAVDVVGGYFGATGMFFFGYFLLCCARITSSYKIRALKGARVAGRPFWVKIFANGMAFRYCTGVRQYNVMVTLMYVGVFCTNE